MVELISVLKPFGPFGLFFLAYIYERYLSSREIDNLRADLRAEMKEINQKIYDYQRRMDDHLLMLIGALTEVQAGQKAITDRMDVLLRRGDRG